MADPTKTTKRTRVIALISLLLSLIGISLVIVVALFSRILHANGVDVFVLGGLSFPFGALAWMFAREIKSPILTMLGVIVTFSFPVFLTIAHYTAGP